MIKRRIIIFSVLTLILIFSCKKDKWVGDVAVTGFPNNIGYLMLSKCSVAGCHNDASKDAAGGISLSTWDKLFEGGRGGAAVIPYRSDFSDLCYFINTDPANGPAINPTMPVGSTPLTQHEYEEIKEWIDAGAPNNQNFVKFSDNPARKKVYVASHLCDEVTVFDSESLLQMRYIRAGVSEGLEYPNLIKVAPDNKNWYLSFHSATGMVQKFDATNDKLSGQITLGSGLWSAFDITSDSQFGFFVSYDFPGKITYADIKTPNALASYTFSGNFVYPNSIIIDNTHKKLYVGAQNGNYIYVIDVNDPYSPIINEHAIDGTSVVNYNSQLDVGSFCLTSDDKICFIGCKTSNEVRFLYTATDSVKAVINLPSPPEAMDTYPNSNLLFVSCPDDITSFPGSRGSVVVIDYNTKSIIKKINSGYQPYGIAVDKIKGIVTVANSNLNPGGPAPHHVSACGGRNGYVTFIDVNTLQLIPGKKIETTVFPHSVSVRN